MKTVSSTKARGREEGRLPLDSGSDEDRSQSTVKPI